MSETELSARERIAAHELCREADDLADHAPWAAWFLRPLARWIRKADADLHRPDDLHY